MNVLPGSPLGQVTVGNGVIAAAGTVSARDAMQGLRTPDERKQGRSEAAGQLKGASP